MGLLSIFGLMLLTGVHTHFIHSEFQRMPVTYADHAEQLRPRQTGHYFADAIFKCLSLNENIGIPIKISLKCVPAGLINTISALV